MIWQKLAPHIKEERVPVGTDVSDARVIGVSNELGLHASSRSTSADLSRYQRIELNWFAYNPMRVNIGSIGLADTDEKTGITSPDYTVFSCLDTLNPYYLLYYLTSETGLDEIGRNCSGAVRKRLYYSGLSNINIPIPDLDEQQALVDKVFAIERIRDAFESSRKKAEVLLQQVLKESFA